jgi:hypothetical protein
VVPEIIVRTDAIPETAPLPHGSTTKTWQARSWRYDDLAIFFLILNAISALLFIRFVDRPIYDDAYNILDVHRYASEGVSVDTVRRSVNAPGPTSFVWMAAGVRLLGGNELRAARLAALSSWLLLGAGILIGARHSKFPQLWHSALLVTLVFPHAATSSASVLTEGPALLFAMIGVLIWVESVSRPTITLRLVPIAIIGGLFMGIAVTCRQYYLMLLPAAVLVAVIQSRRVKVGESSLWYATVILSLATAMIPVFLLVLTWKGFTSPGVGHSMWNTGVGISGLRPVVTIFYVALYLVPLSFPAMLRLQSAQHRRALLLAALVGIGVTYFRSDLLQPGPVMSLVRFGGRVPAGELIIFALIAFITIYNGVALGFQLWSRGASLFSSPLVSFALLAILFFILEQAGVGGNMPLYDRYLLQLAPFLGLVAFDVLPGLTSKRLLGLLFLSVVGQVMLWRHAFDG